METCEKRKHGRPEHRGDFNTEFDLEEVGWEGVY